MVIIATMFDNSSADYRDILGELVIRASSTLNIICISIAGFSGQMNTRPDFTNIVAVV